MIKDIVKNEMLSPKESTAPQSTFNVENSATDETFKFSAQQQHQLLQSQHQHSSIHQLKFYKNRFQQQSQHFYNNNNNNISNENDHQQVYNNGMINNYSHYSPESYIQNHHHHQQQQHHHQNYQRNHSKYLSNARNNAYEYDYSNSINNEMVDDECHLNQMNNYETSSNSVSSHDK